MAPISSGANSASDMPMRVMFCCARNSASMRVGSLGITTQWRSLERFMIWRAKLRVSWSSKRQPRNRKLRPVRQACTAAGMGVWMSISVSTST